jgi:hypothetical protein
MLARKVCGGEPERGHRDGLALQVTNRLHAVSAEQLEATDVGAGQDDDGIPSIDLREQGTREVQVDIGLA